MAFPGPIPSYGMTSDPSLKRDRAPPLSYNAVSTTGPGVAGGRFGELTPGTTIPFGQAAAFSGANPISIDGISVGGGITTTAGVNTNSYSVYSIKPRPYTTEVFKASFEKAQMWFTYRNPRDLGMSHSPKSRIGADYRGYPEFDRLSRLHKSPQMYGTNPVMANLVLLNYILASSEPAVTDPAKAWTADDVINKWSFVGIARNQEGGQTYYGEQYKSGPGKDFVVNLTINGRADSVYNAFGQGVTDISPLILIVKRTPRPNKYYLDPHQDVGVTMTDTRKVSPKASNMLSSAGREHDMKLVRNPYQFIPFQPTSMKPRPTLQDLMGMNDFGEVDIGKTVKLGRLWHLPPISNSRLDSSKANDVRAIVSQPTASVVLDMRPGRIIL